MSRPFVHPTGWFEQRRIPRLYTPREYHVLKSTIDADGRVQLKRAPEERAPLLARLRRVEGQVRGLIEMVEADRYCGDELQQLAAARAALREVATLLAAMHVTQAARHAIETGDTGSVMVDIQAVLRGAFRQE